MTTAPPSPDSLSRLREIMAEDPDGALYVGGAPHPSVVAAKRVADFLVSPEAVEAVARVMSPASFTEAERLLALRWKGIPAPATAHARDVIAIPLAKARTIIALIAAAGVTDDR